VASVTGSDLYENVKGMLRSGLIAWLICLTVYSFLSWQNPLTEVDPAAIAAFESTFDISMWTLLPAAVILIFPLIHVPILITLITSIAAASAISLLLQGTSVSDLLYTLFLGYHSPNPALSSIIDGGGVISMLSTVIIVAIACSYTGIMNGTGMIDRLRSIVSRLEGKIGLFPCVMIISFMSACIFCNQVVGIIMSNELMKSSYEAKEKKPFDIAMDIENASITIPALVPWCILITVPLSIFGVTHEAVPFAIYIYAIPLVHLINKILRRDLQRPI
jgi:NhaC family Na+:H+ antiporter